MSQRNDRPTQTELIGVTRWLIRRAARRAPECLSSRLEEEWLVDSEYRSSALSRLRFAVGCCWASVVIVNEYPRKRIPAASNVVVARGGFISLTDRNFGYVSLRSGTLFLIVGIHAALFCGLITTLSQTHGSPTARDSQNHVLNRLPAEIE
jgi:hypothetical protein